MADLRDSFRAAQERDREESNSLSFVETDEVKTEPTRPKQDTLRVGWSEVDQPAPLPLKNAKSSNDLLITPMFRSTIRNRSRSIGSAEDRAAPGTGSVTSTESGAMDKRQRLRSLAPSSMYLSNLAIDDEKEIDPAEIEQNVKILKFLDAFITDEEFISQETRTLVARLLSKDNPKKASPEQAPKLIASALKDPGKLDTDARKLVFSSIATGLGQPYLRFLDPEAELGSKWIHCQELEGQKRDFWYSEKTRRMQFDIPVQFDLDSPDGQKYKPFQGMWVGDDGITAEIKGNTCTRGNEDAERLVFRRVGKGDTMCYKDWVLDMNQSDGKVKLCWKSGGGQSQEIMTWSRKAPNVVPDPSTDFIEEMIMFKKSLWNFNNPRVIYQQARSLEKNYTNMLPDPITLIYPRYLAPTRPIPDQRQKLCVCRVSTPKDYSPQEWITMKISEKDKAIDLVTRVIKKRFVPQKKGIPPSEFILKAKGREEYLHPEDMILENEYVRRGLRDDTNVDLVLLHIPNIEAERRTAESQQELLVQSFKTVYNNDFEDERMEIAAIEHHLNIDGNLAQKGEAFEPTGHILLHECNWDFTLKILSVEGLLNLENYDPTKYNGIGVQLSVSIGSRDYDSLCRSADQCLLPVPSEEWCQDEFLFNKTLGPGMHGKSYQFADLRRETMLTFFLVPFTNVKDKQRRQAGRPLAYLRVPLIDHLHRLQSGRKTYPMWEIRKDQFLRSCKRWGAIGPRDTRDQARMCSLTLEFPTFAYDVIAPRTPPVPVVPHANPDIHLMPTAKKTEKLDPQVEKIIRKLPSKGAGWKGFARTPAELQLIWKYRHHLVHRPEALPLFLRATDWKDKHHQAEAHKLMHAWAPFKSPELYMQLLNWDFQDTTVREYATHKLNELTDADLRDFLLQFLQILKFEIHHDNPTSRFLIARALRQPLQIGHYLFWGLKAEYHTDNLESLERTGVLLEEFLRHCSQDYVRKMLIQERLIRRFEHIAAQIAIEKKRGGDPAEVKAYLRRLLKSLNDDLPPKVVIPLNPRFLATSIIPEECRYFSSKKVPLLLTFKNSCQTAADPLKIIFKSGDDLRQDILTIQIMRIMDRIWLDQNLDLKMVFYDVIAMGVNKGGEGLGMLECVTNASTINDIYEKSVSGRFQMRTFNKAAILNHLVQRAGRDFPRAQKIFARSCAGYSITTYCLGIGDRHSDNIMLKDLGHLFHIDFGHFLGNWKYKAGIKRERSKLVFTQIMKHVIEWDKSKRKEKNEKYYKAFEEYCWQAYKTLRDRHLLFILLFELMVPADMPELLQDSDIDYLVGMFALHLDEKAARKQLFKDIDRSINDKFRLFDDYAHYVKHKKK